LLTVTYVKKYVYTKRKRVQTTNIFYVSSSLSTGE
jgi:hypothetical protein